MPVRPSDLKYRQGASRGWVQTHGAVLVESMRVVDALLIFGGLRLAAHTTGAAWHDGMLLVALCALGAFTIAASQRPLYKSWRMVGPVHEIRLIAVSWLVAMLTVFAFGYVFDTWRPLSRAMFAVWAVLSLAAMAGLRVAARLALRALRRHGRNFRAAAIIGATDAGSNIAALIRRNAWMGVVLVGCFDDRTPTAERTDTALGIDGSTAELIQLVRSGEIDIVYIALPLRAELRIQALIDKLRDSTVTIYYVPDFSSFGLLRAQWEVVGGMPVLSLIDTPHHGIDALNKRVLDIVAATVALVLAALPMLAIVVAIRRGSPGPAIFRQPRYGLDGREFMMWKFRSMTVVEDGRHSLQQAQRADLRVTPLGAWLRRLSLDELPQLFNVLQGTMSMVGPRPHPVALNEAQRRLIPGYMLRHKVRPGITGWAQVNGLRGETETPDKMRSRIRYDLEYIDAWSIWLDLRILWMTALRIVGDSNAY